MNKAIISSTDDINIEILNELQSSFPRDIAAEVNKSQFCQRAVEPSSWISLIANGDWWVKAFAACAALYVAEIIKEAAKDSWKNKGKVVNFAAKATDKLKNIAVELFKAKSTANKNTYISIGIPIPDEVYTTILKCESVDEVELAIELALFIHHIPELVLFIKKQKIGDGSTIGWINLDILENGDLQAKWMDKENLEQHVHVLKFQP